MIVSSVNPGTDFVRRGLGHPEPQLVAELAKSPKPQLRGTSALKEYIDRIDLEGIR